MDVDFLILSRYAEMGRDDTLNLIGGGLSLLRSTGMPFIVPTLFVAGRIAFDQEEVRIAHGLQLVLVDPAGEQVLQSEVIPVEAQRGLAT